MNKHGCQWRRPTHPHSIFNRKHPKKFSSLFCVLALVVLSIQLHICEKLSARINHRIEITWLVGTPRAHLIHWGFMSIMLKAKASWKFKLSWESTVEITQQAQRAHFPPSCLSFAKLNIDLMARSENISRDEIANINKRNVFCGEDFHRHEMENWEILCLLLHVERRVMRVRWRTEELFFLFRSDMKATKGWHEHESKWFSGDIEDMFAASRNFAENFIACRSRGLFYYMLLDSSDKFREGFECEDYPWHGLFQWMVRWHEYLFFDRQDNAAHFINCKISQSQLLRFKISAPFIFRTSLVRSRQLFHQSQIWATLAKNFSHRFSVSIESSCRSAAIQQTNRFRSAHSVQPGENIVNYKSLSFLSPCSRWFSNSILLNHFFSENLFIIKHDAPSLSYISSSIPSPESMAEVLG